jgi:hypothetical protein
MDRALVSALLRFLQDRARALVQSTLINGARTQVLMPTIPIIRVKIYVSRHEYYWLCMRTASSNENTGILASTAPPKNSGAVNNTEKIRCFV